MAAYAPFGPFGPFGLRWIFWGLLLLTLAKDNIGNMSQLGNMMLGHTFDLDQALMGLLKFTC